MPICQRRGDQTTLLFWSTLVGNFFNHYDTALYSFLVPLLAHLFFPATPLWSLIFAYAVLPLGFFARLFGAFFFGRMADRWGRRRALILSLFLMAVITSMTGCLPLYQQAGYAAPVALVIFRLFQQFAAAGEATAAPLILLQCFPKEKRSFYSSVFDVSSIAGILFACGLVACAAHLGVQEKAWRAFYLLGSMTGFVGLIFRMNGQWEQEAPQNSARPLAAILRSHKKAACRIALTSGFSYVCYTVPFTLMPAYSSCLSHLSFSSMIGSSTLLLMLDMILLPIFGLLSGKVGKERCMLTAAVVGAVLSTLLFQMVGWEPPLWAFAAQTVFMVIGVMFSAPYHHWVQQQAPQEDAFTVISFGKSIGSQLIGAPFLPLSLWLYQATEGKCSPAFYYILSAIAASIALYQKPIASKSEGSLVSACKNS